MLKPNYLIAGTLALLLAATTALAQDKPTEPARPEDPGILTVRTFAFAAVPGQCDERTADNAEMAKDATYPLTWKDNYGDPPAEHKATLFEIYCYSGAYNTSNLYVVKDEENKLSLVSFASPTFDVAYADGDDTETKLKRDPIVTGYATSVFLTNPSFDEKTRTLSEYSKWRGLGDAWSAGDWQFRDGQFVLTRFEIDPIYEANIDNAPQKLADKSFQLFPPPKRK
ncbi:MAG TPA: DUF1176 domain-containing protein [Ensifer sp.]|nr:DUF1176 domain-containing protein [Ensifer sp.]